MAIYYIDGTTLSNSTVIYSDSALTTCAPDGFYSNGLITRELASCILLPDIICPACDPPCGVTGAISSPGDSAVFKLNTGVGETSSDVGAIKVTFIPNLQGSGIRATFNGNVYNQLSSNEDGFHSSDTVGNYTIVGNTGASGCFALPINFDYAKYNYVGGVFVDSGTTQNVQVDSGDSSLSATSIATTEFIMVIPKLTASPSTINFEVATLCSLTNWTIEIDCPLLLLGYSSTTLAYSSDANASAEPLDATYYNMNVTGSLGEPALYDWVFSDQYGATPLSDGYYGIDTVAFPSPSYMLAENGVVIEISTFP